VKRFSILEEEKEHREMMNFGCVVVCLDCAIVVLEKRWNTGRWRCCCVVVFELFESDVF